MPEAGKCDSIEVELTIFLAFCCDGFTTAHSLISFESSFSEISFKTSAAVFFICRCFISHYSYLCNSSVFVDLGFLLHVRHSPTTKVLLCPVFRLLREVSSHCVCSPSTVWDMNLGSGSSRHWSAVYETEGCCIYSPQPLSLVV